MDIWAQQAHEHHIAAQQATALAGQHRAQRDQAVRRLRREDPQRWTYAALAKAVGCGPELIAKIIQGAS